MHRWSLPPRSSPSLSQLFEAYLNNGSRFLHRCFSSTNHPTYSKKNVVPFIPFTKSGLERSQIPSEWTLCDFKATDTVQSLLEQLENPTDAVWHPFMNGNLLPDMVRTPKHWWLCSNGHAYQGKITKKHVQPCPECQRIAYLEHEKEFHPTKNGVSVDQMWSLPESTRTWWRCPVDMDHEYSCLFKKKLAGYRCPYCAHSRVLFKDSLAFHFPELVKDYHESNKHPPQKLHASRKDHVAWRCQNNPDHVWHTSVQLKARGKTCSICSRETNKFSNLESAAYWHPTKNNGVTPNDVYVTAHKHYWFLCKTNPAHEWTDSPRGAHRRKSGFGCPHCDVADSLKVRYPEIYAQLHPTKNPETFVYRKREYKLCQISVSNATVLWWQCPAGEDHVYEMSIKRRMQFESAPSKKRSQPCPFCSEHSWSVSTHSFAGRHPNMAKELDDTSHPDTDADAVDLERIKHDSKEIFMWKCDENHTFPASCNDRAHHNVNCYRCSETSLAHTHPDIAKDWHPTLNIESKLNPFKVTRDYNESVWWSCTKSGDHVWQETIQSRLQNPGCPFCNGIYPSKTFNLKKLFFYVAQQWHPTLNGELRPQDILPDHGSSVWWRKNNKDIKATPAMMIRPFSMTNKKYELMVKYYDEEKTGIPPQFVNVASLGKIWFKCPDFPEHRYERNVRAVAKNPKRLLTECFECRRQRIGEPKSDMTPISEKHPFLVEQWHPRNMISPEQVPISSLAHVWWQCDVASDHVWQVAPRYRIRRLFSTKRKQTPYSHCPFCAGYQVCHSNMLSTVRPDLAKEWHHEKNGPLKPEMLTSNSTMMCWWQCGEDETHVWQSTVNRRTDPKRNDACPFCSGQRVSRTNHLGVIDPETGKYWHEEKNRISIEKILHNSKAFFWWKCDKAPDHVWYGRVTALRRVPADQKCPYCANKVVCNDNALNTVHPSIVRKLWDRKRNVITPKDCLFNDDRVVFWKCKVHDFSWAGRVKMVVKGASECKICKEERKEQEWKRKLVEREKLKKMRRLERQKKRFENKIKGS